MNGRVQEYTQNVVPGGIGAANTYTIPSQYFGTPRAGRSLVAAALIFRGTALDLSMCTRFRWFSGGDVLIDVRPIHERQWLERFSRQGAAPLANAGPGAGGVNTGIIPFLFNDQRFEAPGLQDDCAFRMGKPVSLQIVTGSAATAGTVDLALMFNERIDPTFYPMRGATPTGIANTSQANQPFVWSVTGELLAFGVPWHNATVANAITKISVQIDGVLLFDGDPQAAVGLEALEANYLNAASITDPGTLSVVWKKVMSDVPVRADNVDRNKIKFDVGASSIAAEEFAFWSREYQPGKAPR